ncbi:DgyrCDS13409 [Dimorphilus gyrociliatus]|uniref:DgyrCDS13409 n=1 Tax=Dimorphilus gyrociliatus TaxID=2664684 RepID=A0A7I8WAN9_9ANNE|nr:DgyrCDS13409 [Dimorphilus gyrociliatus]
MAQSFEKLGNYKEKMTRNDDQNNLEDDEGGEWQKVTNERRKNISSQVVHLQHSIKLPDSFHDYNWKLACKKCFVRTKPGSGGVKFYENMEHDCSRAFLIVRRKGCNGEWYKIRPNLFLDHKGSYLICKHYENKKECIVGENECTFAHSHVEIFFWNQERKGLLRIQDVLRDVKRYYNGQPLPSLKLQDETDNEKNYVPGFVTPQSKTSFNGSTFVQQDRKNPENLSQEICGPISFPLEPTSLFRIGCESCSILLNNSHRCNQNVLYVIDKKDAKEQNTLSLRWIAIRERKDNGQFNGRYVLCHEATGQGVCSVGIERCSFAHSRAERELWSFEKQGEFDINKFIIQQSEGFRRKLPNFERKSSNIPILPIQSPRSLPTPIGDGRTLQVAKVLKEYPGKFALLCALCLKSNIISSQSELDHLYCHNKHNWNSNIVLGHLMQDSHCLTVIRNLPNQVKINHKVGMCESYMYSTTCQLDIAQKMYVFNVPCPYGFDCQMAHSELEKKIWILMLSNEGINFNEFIKISLNSTKEVESDNDKIVTECLRRSDRHCIYYLKSVSDLLSHVKVLKNDCGKLILNSNVKEDFQFINDQKENERVLNNSEDYPMVQDIPCENDRGISAIIDMDQFGSIRAIPFDDSFSILKINNPKRLRNIGDIAKVKKLEEDRCEVISIIKGYRTANLPTYVCQLSKDNQFAMAQPFKVPGIRLLQLDKYINSPSEVAVFDIMISGKIFFKEYVPWQKNMLFYVRCVGFFEKDDISNYIGIVVGTLKSPETTSDQLNLLDELFFINYNLQSQPKFQIDKDSKAVVGYSSLDGQLAISFREFASDYSLTLHVPDVSLCIPPHSELDVYARTLFMTAENRYIVPRNLVEEYFTFTNGKRIFCFSFEFIIDHKTFEIIRMDVDKKTVCCIDTICESIAPEYYKIADHWRFNRLGNSVINQRRNLLVEELEIAVNIYVLKMGKNIPRLIQPRSSDNERLRHTFSNLLPHCIVLKRSLLPQGLVCRCESICKCLGNNREKMDIVYVERQAWKKTFQRNDFLLTDIMNIENIPTSCYAYCQFAKTAVPQFYISGDNTITWNEKYGVNNITSCTRPCSNYFDVCVQRIFNNADNSLNFEELCSAATSSLINLKTYKFCRERFRSPNNSVLASATIVRLDNNGLVFYVHKQEYYIELDHLGVLDMTEIAVGRRLLKWNKRVFDFKSQRLKPRAGNLLEINPILNMVILPGNLYWKLIYSIVGRGEDRGKVMNVLSEAKAAVAKYDERARTVSVDDVVVDGEDCSDPISFSAVILSGSVFTVQLRFTESFLPDLKIQLVKITPSIHVCIEHLSAPGSCFVEKIESEPKTGTIEYFSNKLLKFVDELGAREAVTKRSSISALVRRIPVTVIGKNEAKITVLKKWCLDRCLPIVSASDVKRDGYDLVCIVNGLSVCHGFVDNVMEDGELMTVQFKVSNGHLDSGVSCIEFLSRPVRVRGIRTSLKLLPRTGNNFLNRLIMGEEKYSTCCHPDIPPINSYVNLVTSVEERLAYLILILYELSSNGKKIIFATENDNIISDIIKHLGLMINIKSISNKNDEIESKRSITVGLVDDIMMSNDSFDCVIAYGISSPLALLAVLSVTNATGLIIFESCDLSNAVRKLMSYLS